MNMTSMADNSNVTVAVISTGDEPHSLHQHGNPHFFPQQQIIHFMYEEVKTTNSTQIVYFY